MSTFNLRTIRLLAIAVVVRYDPARLHLVSYEQWLDLSVPSRMRLSHPPTDPTARKRPTR